jgi:hypothetical protein
MADPVASREGNLRLASIPARGYPPDPFAMAREVQRLLEGQEVEAYGPTVVFVNLPPEDQPPQAWDCQVGTAITGLGRSLGAMTIEDYRQLRSLSLPHSGPIRELGATWRRLEAHARAANQRLRPYWRLALRNRRLADGNLLPLAEVAVFIDR